MVTVETIALKLELTPNEAKLLPIVISEIAAIHKCSESRVLSEIQRSEEISREIAHLMKILSSYSI